MKAIIPTLFILISFSVFISYVKGDDPHIIMETTEKEEIIKEQFAFKQKSDEGIKIMIR